MLGIAIAIHIGTKFPRNISIRGVLGWNSLKVIFFPKFENILQKKIDKKTFYCIARKAIIEEVKKSKINTPWAMVHYDPTDLTAILYFDQTSSGGTAFFEQVGDKYPDSTIGAYPNRLLMYNAKRFHAIATDFTFKERYILAFSFNMEKK